MKNREHNKIPRLFIFNAGEGKAYHVPSLYHYVRLLTPLLVATAVIVACAQPVQVMREASSPVRPEWINKPPHKKGVLYFVGIASSAETLEEGLNAGLSNAMSKISNYLGSRVESVFEEQLSEMEQNLRQQISSKSSATVLGATVADSYHEKMVRIENNFRMERYDVYLLVSFSKEEAEKEMARQKREKAEKVNVAYEYYVKGLNKEKRRKLHDARRFYMQALGLLDGIEEVVKLESAEFKNSEELLLALNARLQKVTSSLFSVSLDIRVKNRPSGAARAFRSNFISALNEQGFTVTDTSSAFKITGNVSVSESGYVMNNHVYYAEGSVSAQRNSDGRIITVFPFKVKGFHRTKKQSALNALAEAGKEAGNGLTKLIIEKAGLEIKTR